VDLDSRVMATKEQVSADLNGEAVILNLKSGVYYGLNPIGALVWNQIQEPRRVLDLRDAVMAEYAVEAQVCEQDLLALLEGLLEAGLIEVSDAAPA
jgi:hypothetical protein